MATRPIRRFWLRFVAVCGLLFFLTLAAFAYFYLYAGPPPDDADLRVRGPMVPDDQNGLVQLGLLPVKEVKFALFATAHGSDEATAQKIMDGETWDNALVAAYLQQAAPTLKQLDIILGLPSFETTTPLSPDLILPDIDFDIQAAKTLALSASFHRRAGDYAAAVRDVLRIRRLAVRLTEGHNTLIHFLTATACNGLAVRQAEILLNDPACPAAQLTALQNGFALEPHWAASYQNAIQMEYLYATYMLQALRESNYVPGGTSKSSNKLILFLLKWTLLENTTLRTASRYYRTNLQSLNQPYAAAPAEIKDAHIFTDSLGTGAWFFVKPNLGGRFLLSVLVPTFAQLTKSAYSDIATDHLLQTGFALRRYYDDHHALPSALSDLVPQYLPAVPVDPFDGQPLRYNAAKGLVYSVGTDLADHGGSKLADKPRELAGDEIPIHDSAQPTLVLTFQKSPTATTPAP